MLPGRRTEMLEELNRANDGRAIGPCGGFSTQYAFMCDYHGLPYRAEVSWVICNQNK